jgi:hypothetical protein
MKLRKLFVTIVAATAAIGLAGAASAEDWKMTGEFGWFGVGKAHQIEEGHIYWVGEFSGTFFNDKGEGSLFHRAGMKCPGFQDLDFNNMKSTAGGYCIITDTDGDQAYLSWSIPSGDTVRGPGTFEYTGGTGKYEEISGSNTFVAATQVNWADGTASGYATFNR